LHFKEVKVAWIDENQHTDFGILFGYHGLPVRFGLNRLCGCLTCISCNLAEMADASPGGSRARFVRLDSFKPHPQGEANLHTYPFNHLDNYALQLFSISGDIP
jgi:hypothetical protein